MTNLDKIDGIILQKNHEEFCKWLVNFAYWLNPDEKFDMDKLKDFFRSQYVEHDVSIDIREISNESALYRQELINLYHKREILEQQLKKQEEYYEYLKISVSYGENIGPNPLLHYPSWYSYF